MNIRKITNGSCSAQFILVLWSFIVLCKARPIELFRNNQKYCNVDTSTQKIKRHQSEYIQKRNIHQSLKDTLKNVYQLKFFNKRLFLNKQTFPVTVFKLIQDNSFPLQKSHSLIVLSYIRNKENYDRSNLKILMISKNIAVEVHIII